MTALLETRAISKRFGGLQAVRDVDFRLDRGEIRALIGPNGAGKTTLVGLICGRMGPTSGRVLFKGEDITGLGAPARVIRGIAYTFQITSIFRKLSVWDNVALASQRLLLRGPLDRLVLGRSALDPRVRAALARVGLADASGREAGSLPYGHQKLLEIAMVLALQPELLILDEPTQGLAEEEIAALCALLRQIAAEATVLLIEHNMRVVLDLARTITVMDQGVVIAEGTPAEIEAHPDVQRAYLGT